MSSMETTGQIKFQSRGKAGEVVVAGLDLAGVETRPTGCCILINMKAQAFLLYKDEEIVKKMKETAPEVIAIDAPLSLPAGRKSLDERSSIHLRGCDRELLKRGIRFFPLTLGPMRKLTSRGIRFRQILEAMQLKVIEVYPGGAQDLLGIARKQKGLDELRKGLVGLGIEGATKRMNGDELDAITCAYVGKLCLEGKVHTYGTNDGQIIMPDL